MILLGIDTCGSVGTLTLARLAGPEELEVLGAVELPGRSTAARLIPELKRMLLDAGVLIKQVEGLVVVDGPGSFTGIRIGLSTAKALAEACSLPVFAISRLQVLAIANHSSCAVLDAGRGEFFLGCYAAWSGGPTYDEDETGPGEWLLTQEELVLRLKQPAHCAICEEKAAAVIAGAQLWPPPTATDALYAALPQVRAGQQCAIAELDGRYVRRSDLYRLAQPAAL